jgi:hypothetical protein
MPTCSNNPLHVYAPHLRQCPWCEIEKAHLQAPTATLPLPRPAESATAPPPLSSTTPTAPTQPQQPGLGPAPAVATPRQRVAPFRRTLAALLLTSAMVSAQAVAFLLAALWSLPYRSPARISELASPLVSILQASFSFDVLIAALTAALAGWLRWLPKIALAVSVLPIVFEGTFAPPPPLPIIRLPQQVATSIYAIVSEPGERTGILALAVFTSVALLGARCATKLIPRRAGAAAPPHNGGIRGLIGSPSRRDRVTFVLLMVFVLTGLPCWFVGRYLMQQIVFEPDPLVFDQGLRRTWDYTSALYLAGAALFLLTFSVVLIFQRWRGRVALGLAGVMIAAVTVTSVIPQAQGLWRGAEAVTARPIPLGTHRVEKSGICGKVSGRLRSKDGRIWNWQLYATRAPNAKTCRQLELYRGLRLVATIPIGPSVSLRPGATRGSRNKAKTTKTATFRFQDGKKEYRVRLIQYDK